MLIHQLVSIFAENFRIFSRPFAQQTILMVNKRTTKTCSIDEYKHQTKSKMKLKTKKKKYFKLPVWTISMKKKVLIRMR